MAVALAYPETEKRGGKRDRGQSLKIKDCEVNAGYVSQARFVLRNCRDKALEVLRNAKYPLTVAYEEAQAIVEEQRLAEEERQRQLAALAVNDSAQFFVNRFHGFIARYRQLSQILIHEIIVWNPSDFTRFQSAPNPAFRPLVPRRQFAGFRPLPALPNLVWRQNSDIRGRVIAAHSRASFRMPLEPRRTRF
mgnify:FL=1